MCFSQRQRIDHFDPFSLFDECGDVNSGAANDNVLKWFHSSTKYILTRRDPASSMHRHGRYTFDLIDVEQFPKVGFLSARLIRLCDCRLSATCSIY